MDKTCESCKHCVLMGKGDIYCPRHEMVKSDYDWDICSAYKEEK